MFISNCQYLCGQEAHKILGLSIDRPEKRFVTQNGFCDFGHEEAMKKVQTINNNISICEDVNRCLGILRKVHQYLLTNKNAFFLLNAKLGIDQCHLLSLMAFDPSLGDLYCQLALFRNHGFQNNPDTYLVLIKSMLKEMNQVLGKKDEKMLEKFFKSKNFHLISDEARKKLIEILQKYIQENLSKGTKDIDKELYQLSKENLYLNYGDDKYKTQLYTFPSLAGVIYFVNRIVKNSLPVVLKICVMGQDGIKGTLVEYIGEKNIKENTLLLSLRRKHNKWLLLYHGSVKRTERCLPPFLLSKKMLIERNTTIKLLHHLQDWFRN